MAHCLLGSTDSRGAAGVRPGAVGSGMGEALQSLMASTPLAALAIAFLVGLACGWLVWGLRGMSGDSADGEKPDAAGAEADGDERKEVVVLRAEIEAARALLGQNDAHQDEIAKQLQSVDEALKRANGRLKVIQQGLKR